MPDETISVLRVLDGNAADIRTRRLIVELMVNGNKQRRELTHKEFIRLALELDQEEWEDLRECIKGYFGQSEILGKMLDT